MITLSGLLALIFGKEDARAAAQEAEIAALKESLKASQQLGIQLGEQLAASQAVAAQLQSDDVAQQALIAQLQADDAADKALVAQLNDAIAVAQERATALEVLNTTPAAAEASAAIEATIPAESIPAVIVNDETAAAPGPTEAVVLEAIAGILAEQPAITEIGADDEVAASATL